MKADMMILGDGEKAVYSTDCDETGLNNNVIVCAGSGSGKTMSIMEPRLLETYNSSLVVTCTKRRVVQKYRELFAERGYNVLDLNFTDPIKSDVAYDPLSYVSSNSDIAFLASSIVMAHPGKINSPSDPFWDDSAISLLSALISYVLATMECPKFVEVLELFDDLTFRECGSSMETSLDGIFEKVIRRAPHSYAATCWKTFAGLPVRTAGAVYGVLSTTIDKVFSPELRKMIANKPGVGFEDLAKRKTVLFVTTSPVNPSLNYFVNMFYGQMFKQLFEYAESLPNGKLPNPVTVLADDFATGSRILNFPEYISIFREKQISVMLLIQSETQLESIYGYHDAVTIINNCDSYVYMGGMDIATCRKISERLNVPLEDVLYMPIGEEIIFRRGSRPVKTQRYNVLNNPMYQSITQNSERSLSIAEKCDISTKNKSRL
ncbi:MAG: type IV secretory system conjugative DNA transfer family protein [Ruminococcus sp.]|nr:type IV secretory system conjugative DNA transfer family protein [Ruminococcus sp.]